MDISQVNTDKCNLEQYNDHEQIYLFNELYRKYNGKPKKALKEKSTAKKESGEQSDEDKPKKRGPAKGTPKVPMDIKFKQNVADKVHMKVFEENCNGKTHEILAKEYGVSKYMVAKLIKQAREERKTSCTTEAQSDVTKQEQLEPKINEESSEVVV